MCSLLLFICHKKQTLFVFVLFILSFFFTVLISDSTGQSNKEKQIKKKLFFQSKGERYSFELLANWKNIENGIDSQDISLLDQSGRIKVQLKFFRFNPVLFDIRVLCSKNFGFRRTDVKTLAKLSGSVAIINSSYFDIHENPIAYLKCNGKVLNSRVATHSLYSGVFLVKHGQPFILHTSNFDPKDTNNDAVQVGPRLITKGRDTAGLKNIHAVHHRSGVALDRKGNVIIYVTNSQYQGISWNTLRYILKQKEIDGYEVLNLDGGGSAQMYISTKSLEEYIRGSTGVPSAIAFFRKR